MFFEDENKMKMKMKHSLSEDFKLKQLRLHLNDQSQNVGIKMHFKIKNISNKIEISVYQNFTLHKNENSCF